MFDLSGNVWEWEDSCQGAGDTAECHIRGGGHTSNETNALCKNGNHKPRNERLPYLGFRCCSD